MKKLNLISQKVLLIAAFIFLFSACTEEDDTYDPSGKCGSVYSVTQDPVFSGIPT